MSVKTTRICDVCETEYTETLPAWMVLALPNAPENIPTEYDVCGFDCLKQFVADEDEGVPEKTVDVTTSKEDNVDVLPLQPRMTLAEAIASGQLDFRRGQS